MESQTTGIEQEMNNDARHISGWSGLRKQMTVSYILLTLISVAVLEFLHTALYLFIPLPPVPWYILGGVDLFLLIVVPLMGGLFGIVSTRRLLQRIQGLTTATTQFASGRYEQRLPALQKDEIGQLEEHFNRMVAQLAESTARQQTLIEQGARREERARLARDLHDSVKQQVFAVSMQIGTALVLLDNDRETTRVHLLEAEGQIQQAQQELTTLIHELRPLILQDDKGLAAVLRDYIVVWSHQHSIAVDVHLPETCILPLPVEEALLRVAQEAFSNIARHSHATSVQIELTCEEQQVTLAITDNGQGFDRASLNGSGVGLHSMQERMAALKGSAVIESKPEEGTRLLARCTNK